jgi:NTE family protein
MALVQKIVQTLGLRRKTQQAGLALASGGAKGLAHIGVIETLEELGITIECIAGSSIGAVVGAVYACGSLKRFREAMLAMTKREMLRLVDPVIPKRGCILGDKLVAFFGEFIPPRVCFEDLPIPLTVVATDFASGQRAIFAKGPVIAALRASMSIPGVFVPVEIGGRIYIDGGAADVLPADLPRSMGAKRVIAVGLHPAPEGSAGTIMKEEAFLAVPAKGFVRSRSSPGIVTVVMRSIDIMDHATEASCIATDKPDLVIQPAIHDIGTLEFDQSASAIEAGRVAVHKLAHLIAKL